MDGFLRKRMTVVMTLSALLVSGQGASPNDMREADIKSMTGDRLEDGDIRHLQEHLDGYANIDASKLSKEERDFFFFSLHDIDKNQALDGWEMLDALGHIAEEYHYVKNHLRPKFGNDTKMFTEKFLAYVSEGVDTILREDDTNEDGYIQYAEHRRSPRKHWTSEAIDKKKAGHG